MELSLVSCEMVIAICQEDCLFLFTSLIYLSHPLLKNFLSGRIRFDLLKIEKAGFIEILDTALQGEILEHE